MPSKEYTIQYRGLIKANSHEEALERFMELLNDCGLDEIDFDVDENPFGWEMS